MRFKIYEKGQLKTGLRFDIDGYSNNTEYGIAIKEKDMFTIEAILYKKVPKYSNYGHWGQHIFIGKQIDELLIEIDVYMDFLKNKKEKEYYLGLNENNFKEVFKDIHQHRSRVIRFAYEIKRWIETNKFEKLVIGGI